MRNDSKEGNPRSSLHLPTVLAGVAGGTILLLGAFWLARGGQEAWWEWATLLVGFGMAGLLLVYATERRWAIAELTRSEERYRMLAESLNEGLGIANEHNIVTYVNKRFCEMLDRSAEELLGSRPEQFFDAESRKQMEAQLANRQAGESGRYELDLRRKDGSRMVVLVSGRPVFDDTGTFKGTFANLVDITERKIAEETLARTNEELEAMFDAFPDLSFRLAEDGTILSHRAGGTKDLYLSPDEFLGKRVQDIFPPPACERYAAAIEEVQETKSLVAIEYSLVIDGTEQIFEGRLSPLRGGEILLFVRNITKRKQAEIARAWSEERYRILVEGMDDGVAVQDEQGRIVYANRRLRDMLGYTAEEMANVSVFEVTAEQSHDEVRRQLAARRRGESGSYEAVGKRKNGETFRSRVFSQAILDDDGKFRGAFATVREIKVPRDEVEEIATRAKEYNEIKDSQIELFCTYQQGGVITSVNDAYCRFFGKTQTELVGQNFLQFISPEDQEKMVELMASLSLDKPAATHEHRVLGLEGQVYWQRWTNRATRFDETGCASQISAVGLDITDRKRAEEQLHALSTELLLAQDGERRRLAHELHDEFGQLLAVTTFSARRLQQNLPVEREDLKEMNEQLCKDLATAIETMRTIQKGLHPTVLEHLGLSTAIDNLVADFQERAGIACNLDQDTGEMDLDADRQIALYRILQEALTNIARHADASEVDVTIRGDGPSLRLEVRDDGRGIDPASASAFTSYGITGMRTRAEHCGGKFDIHALPAGGTLLTVEVPIGCAENGKAQGTPSGKTLSAAVS